MKRFMLVVAVVVAGTAWSGGGIARAQESGALVDALVKKGVLSNQEAEDIRADLQKEYVKSPAGKMAMSDYITRLKLFGDARLRYEYRSGMAVQNPSDTSANIAHNGQDNQEWRTRDRYRYRLRLGADYTFTDNFSATVRLETSNSGTSTNVTMGDDNATGNSPWSKGNDGIFVGQAYLTYKPVDWCTLIGGRQPVPFVNTNMIWDDDLNPEGASEKFTYKVDKFDLALNMGQYVYDYNDDRAVGGVGQHTTWMLGQQIVAKYNYAPQCHAQIAPTLYAYVDSGHGSTTSNTSLWYTGNTLQDAAAGQSTSNDLLVFDVPVEVQFPVWDRPLRFFGDFAVNMMANQRAWHAGRSIAVANDDSYTDSGYRQYVASQGDQDTAFRLGLEYGKKKAKGDWLVGYFYQRVEAFSIDTNLTDSDVFDRGVNMEGHSFYASYNFTDFLTGGVRACFADAIDKKLPTGNNGDTVTTNTLGQYQLVQVDLSWKF